MLWETFSPAQYTADPANCNNKNNITKEFLKMGIYFPSQDASWELPNNSDYYNYQDMYFQSKKFDIKDCFSETGRDVNEENTDLKVILCSSCGINGAHARCGKVDIKDETAEFRCLDCGGDLTMSGDRPKQRRSRLAEVRKYFYLISMNWITRRIRIIRQAR